VNAEYRNLQRFAMILVHMAS